MNPNKPYTTQDEQIKAQIDSLDGAIPADVQWKPGQSWATINQKLPKTKPHQHTLWLYRGSIAAALLCLIVSAWVLSEHSDSGETLNHLSQKNEAIPEKSSRKKIKNTQKPNHKTFQTYQHNLLQIAEKAFKKSKQNLTYKKTIYDTLPPLTPKAEQNLVLVQNPWQEKEIQEKQKETKIPVNQQVTLSIAPEALLKSDKKRMSPNQPKELHLGSRRKHKIRVKILFDQSEQAPVTSDNPFEKLSTKIKLKEKKQ